VNADAYVYEALSHAYSMGGECSVTRYAIGVAYRKLAQRFAISREIPGPALALALSRLVKYNWATQETIGGVIRYAPKKRRQS